MEEPFVKRYRVAIPRYKNTTSGQIKAGETQVEVELHIDIDAILQHHSYRALHNKCGYSKAGHVAVKLLQKFPK